MNELTRRDVERGIVMISVLLMVTTLLALLSAYFLITRVELKTTLAASNSARGFSAAEAGLNLRADEIRQTFAGYNRPAGVSPGSDSPCESGNTGEGDFACRLGEFGSHTVTTYVEESPGNPIITTIPPGELYQNLNAQEYRYTVRATARNRSRDVEAILELRFKSRLVPLFQFIAFYNKDLEILPGPSMLLSGPVHANGDLYLNTENELRVQGQISAAGRLFRGRKNTNRCDSKPVLVKDPGSYRALVETCGSRVELQEEQLTPWNGMIQIGVDEVTVPAPEALDPFGVYWQKADLRLVLHLDSTNNPNTQISPSGVEIRQADGSVDIAASANLAACPGGINNTSAVGYSHTFYNNREQTKIRMLEVDLKKLLNCIHNVNLAGSGGYLLNGRALNDATEGGLVFYMTVMGPSSAESSNSYGIRIRNGATIRSEVSGAPAVRGMTIVSDQAVYLAQNYNTVTKIPAAILCDSFNVLSNAWNFNDAASLLNVDSRIASDTTANVAILAGTDTTGGAESAAGQDLDEYNGGLENYPRFHEGWTSRTFRYRGSFVSLNAPRHVDGAWVYGQPQYKAPNRDWDFDSDFNDAAKLPPMTPRFVYLRQELFVRDFEQ